MASVPKWKAGDVALVTQYRTPRLAVVQPRPQAGGALQFTYLDFAGYDMVANTEAHPLVVVDPEDREQLDALTKALVEACHAHGNTIVAGNGIHPETMQGALREFANPTPPIEEPTGYGAVVEDADGQLWIHLEQGIWYCVKHGREDWAGVKAVRVLSEGVPAEAKS